MILEPLPAWIPDSSGFPAVNKSPKHHLCDTALAARLNGASPRALASGDPQQAQLFTQLFESFVVLTARVAAEAFGGKAFHLRTRQGNHEVDLLIEDTNKNIVGIDVKFSPAVKHDDVRHLVWLRDQLGSRWSGGVVVHAGAHLYQRSDGIWVVPLAAFG